MNEFADVLAELIGQGKSAKLFNIQKLAKEAGITPSYLSNLKHTNYSPPAHKTLIKMIDAMRRFGVRNADIQRLLDAYNRTQLGVRPEGNLLSALVDLYQKERGFLGRLQHDTPPIAPTEVHLKHYTGQRGLERGLYQGSFEDLCAQAYYFLHALHDRHTGGGKIFISWQHCLHAGETGEMSKASEELLQQLLDTIRTLLWVESPYTVHILSSCEITTNITLLQAFLAEFIGTSNCLLYEISNTAYLPLYMAIEGLGFIEARPKGENRFWIRTFLRPDPENEQADELTALIEHLEYIIACHDAQAVVQTDASLEKFAPTPGLRRLAETEKEHATTERLLIRSTFSALYVKEETLRARLQVLHLPKELMASYLELHRQRRRIFFKRLEHGEERVIHPKNFFRQGSLACLRRAFSKTGLSLTVCKTEAIILQEQILQILEILKKHPNFHFALTEQEWPIHVVLVGDMVFFGFDLPHASEVPYAARRELEAIAWTRHTEVTSLLKREFTVQWNQIDERWRTDTEEGRQHVIHFIIRESIEAFVCADISVQDLGSFLQALLERVPYLDQDTFTRELYLQEQAARDIVILSNSFPLATVPANIGPWPSKSAVRTHQRLLLPILREVDSFHMISMQQGVERYWDSNRYRNTRFQRAWTEQHFHAVLDLLEEPFETSMSCDVIPSAEPMPVEVEIIDREYIFFENSIDKENGQRLIIQDRSLAEELLKYIERSITTDCPPHLKGRDAVATWIKALPKGA